MTELAHLLLAADTFQQTPATAQGRRIEAFSAALLSQNQTPFEALGTAVPDLHTLVFKRAPFRAETFWDGQWRSNLAYNRDDYSLVPGGVAPRVIFKDKFDLLLVFLPHALLTRLYEEEFERSPRAIELIDPQQVSDDLVSQYARVITEEIRTPTSYSGLQMDAIGSALGIYLLRRHSNVRADATCPHKGGLTARTVARVTEYVDAHLGRELTLSELASIAGYSPWHFHRAFRRSTGLTPHDLLVTRRIDRARSLLLETDLPVVEIAGKVGYRSPRSFAAVFKQRTGLAPTQYRGRIRSRGP